MGVSRLRTAFRRSSTQESVTPVAVTAVGEKNHEIPHDAESAMPATPENPELPTEDTQQGVKELEAVTLSWTKTTLIAVFVK